MLQRTIEDEFFPCMRKYGSSLYACQPLAGGFLTDRSSCFQVEFEAGSRLHPKGLQRNLHRNDAYFDALGSIRVARQKHGLAIGEVSLR